MNIFIILLIGIMQGYYIHSLIHKSKEIRIIIENRNVSECNPPKKKIEHEGIKKINNYIDL